MLGKQSDRQVCDTRMQIFNAYRKVSSCQRVQAAESCLSAKSETL